MLVGIERQADGSDAGDAVAGEDLLKLALGRLSSSPRGQPPDPTRTSPSTFSGCASAYRQATLPPMDEPTSVKRAAPMRSMTLSTTFAIAPIVTCVPAGIRVSP